MTTNYQKLSISANSRPNIIQFLQKYQHYLDTKTLILQHNKELVKIPVQVVKNQLLNIQKLEISSNAISNMEQFFSETKLNKVLKMEIRRQKIAHLPKLIMNNVKEIYLSQNNLESIENFSKGEYPLLAKISIFLNPLKKIPALNCKQVKEINFDDNQIQDVSELANSYFPHLTSIDLQRNELKSLPILQSESLITVYLKKNEISDLNEFLRTPFAKLNRLDVSMNKLVKFPEFKSQIRMQILRFLDISNNKVISIQALSFINAPNILSISLQKNLITKFSPAFNKMRLPFVQFLNLSNNFINELNISKCEFSSKSYIIQIIVESQKRSLQKEAQFYNDFSGHFAPHLLKINTIKLRTIRFHHNHLINRIPQKLRKNFVKKYGFMVALLNYNK